MWNVGDSGVRISNERFLGGMGRGAWKGSMTRDGESGGGVSVQRVSFSCVKEQRAEGYEAERR